MDESITRFAKLAREFCQWAEGAPASAEIEAETARRYVASLYAQASLLPPGECGDKESGDVSREAWEVVFSRFGILPVNYYSTCFHPLIVPAEEPCIGDLADDLADIWRELKGGLILFDAGHVDAAVFEWRLGFDTHWGRHIASALYVLQCWKSESRERLVPRCATG